MNQDFDSIEGWKKVIASNEAYYKNFLQQTVDAFQFIDLALQYEDQNQILRSGVRMAEVRARAHVMQVEITKVLEK